MWSNSCQCKVYFLQLTFINDVVFELAAFVWLHWRKKKKKKRIGAIQILFGKLLLTVVFFSFFSMKIYFRHKLCIYICFSHTMHVSFDFIFKFLLLEKYRPAIKYEMSPVTPYTMNITPKNNINDEMKWHTWYILQQKTATPYIGAYLISSLFISKTTSKHFC